MNATLELTVVIRPVITLLALMHVAVRMDIVLMKI